MASAEAQLSDAMEAEGRAGSMEPRDRTLRYLGEPSMTIRLEPSPVAGIGSYQNQRRSSAVQELIARLRDWEFACGIALVFFVAVVGVLLTVQHWNNAGCLSLAERET